MHRKPRIRGRLIATGLSVALLFGCAGLPTSPTDALAPGEYVSNPQWASTGTVEEPQGLQFEVKKKKEVRGEVGGSVSAGRFTVAVPQGAYIGAGEISVDVPDSTVLRVALHITGVANSFAEPVALVVDWDDALGELESDPTALQMAWFDEVVGEWVIIPSVVDLEARTITTYLEHFSEYGVIEAKAGW